MFCLISMEEFSSELLSNHRGAPLCCLSRQGLPLESKEKNRTARCEAMARTRSITCLQELLLRSEAGRGEEGFFILLLTLKEVLKRGCEIECYILSSRWRLKQTPNTAKQRIPMISFQPFFHSEETNWATQKWGVLFQN